MLLPYPLWKWRSPLFEQIRTPFNQNYFVPSLVENAQSLQIEK